MQRLVLTIWLCSMLGAAWAADATAFRERVRHAQSVERETGPRAYLEKNLIPALEASSVKHQVHGCLNAPGASKESFTLVANITKGGVLSDIDYLPRTNTAQCIAKAMGMVKVAVPPDTLDAAGLPMYIDWNLSK